jgi:hypothetical protein
MTQIQYGAFTEAGIVQGQVISVGGKRDRVSVYIQDGEDVWICHTSRDRARELARHIFGSPVRVTGLARWERDRNGHWHQNDFTIKEFESLDGETLEEAVGKLRSIKGEWKKADALKRLAEIRSLIN